MSVTIKVDRSRFEEAMKRLEAVLRDKAGMLGAIAARLEEITRRAFAQERSPEGQPWKPLSVPYARLRTGGGILNRSGRLQRSVRSGVRGDTAFVEATAPHAAAHQFGHVFPGRTIRAKGDKPLRFSFFDGSLNAVFARHAKVGPRRLPARPFLPSAETVEREAVAMIEKRIEKAIRG